MRIEKASGTRAAHALLAHIRGNDWSIPEFAGANGLDRIKLQKVIRGDIERIDVDFAFAVERATDGAVPASWWTEPAPDSGSGSGEHSALGPAKTGTTDRSAG